MSLAAGTRLGPYEILTLIGVGGMGEVHRARDTRLDRDVAIKVLTSRFSADDRFKERFEHEAKAIAAISHPNILSIYDTGFHDGKAFIVTELLEGQTLRAALEAGALPIRQGTDIASQIARGLMAAHAKGILHRDLKPENIFLLEDERVKIVDFGVARQTLASADATAAALTQAGAILGTTGYMAPEQVRGLPTDERTDLFALGVVLYEMLAGSRAFRGETPADSMLAAVRDEPPALAGVRVDLPPALVRIVERCLAKDPANRFTSAREFLLAIEASDAASSSATRLPVPMQAADPPDPRMKPSIAGLPFANMSADTENEYFCDGLAEELLNALAQIESLHVAARTSAFPSSAKT